MKSEKTWILTVMIGAFAAGIIGYDYFSSPGDAPNSAVDTKIESNRHDSSSAESVFSFFKSPRPMPELKFINRRNREISLDAFKGSFVLLNIWATWCVPCREEMPALDRLQSQLGGADFEVLALSIDKGSPTVIRKFYKQLEIESLKVYHDPTGGASFTLEVPGIPDTFLLDRDGKGLGYVVGPVEWDRPEVVEEIRGYLSAKN